MTNWTMDDIPDQTGKVFVITGANSGIGYEATLGLVRKGARVVMACRDAGRAEEAAGAVLEQVPDAAIEVMTLDLADLSSVHAFAEAFAARYRRLDVLCNNAGVMAIPYRTTVDDFEMQLGTNHMGHFALTGLLLGCLDAAPAGRVVTVSSNAHRMGRVDFDDLHRRNSYRRWEAYGQSKLANLLFAFELQRRLERAGRRTVSVACHPGYSATNLVSAGPRMDGTALVGWVMSTVTDWVGQSAEKGALPTVYAATAPEVHGGGYYGPSGFAELWGYPREVGSNTRSRDLLVAAKLWDVSVEQTGVDFGGL